MAFSFRHLKGLNGSLRGSVRAHPCAPGHIFYVSGGAVVATEEGATARQSIMRGHDDQITAFAVSSKGTMVASGCCGQNSDVIIWDTATSSIKHRFQEHDYGVSQLRFSSDDRLLLTAGVLRDQKLFILDTATGKIVSKQMLQFREAATASCWGPVSGTAYSFAYACGEHICLGTIDPYTGMVSCHPVNMGSVRREYTCMAFSKDGAWLFCGTNSADVVTVNVGRKTSQMVHPVCSGGVGDLLVQSNGQVLIAGRDGSLVLFTPDQNWRDVRPFASVPGSITSVSPTADGGALLLGTSQGTIFRVASGSCHVQVVEQSHASGVVNAAFMPGTSDHLVSCSRDGSVCIWSTKDYSLLSRSHEQVEGGAQSVALLPDATISGWADGFIRCHAAHNGAPVWTIPSAHSFAHSCGVPSLSVSNRGAFLVTGGAGGEIRAWDLKSREMVSHMKLHSAPINDLAILADDAHLLACSDDRSLTLWDINQEKCRTSWRSQGAMKALAIAPDRVNVITASLDRRIMHWDIRQADPVRSFPDAHPLEIRALAMNSQGTQFATGSADNTVKLWDFASGRVLTQAAVHTGPVSKVLFSPDDRQLVSTALDGSVVFWDVM